MVVNWSRVGLPLVHCGSASFSLRPPSGSEDIADWHTTGRYIPKYLLWTELSSLEHSNNTDSLLLDCVCNFIDRVRSLIIEGGTASRANNQTGSEPAPKTEARWQRGTFFGYQRRCYYYYCIIVPWCGRQTNERPTPHNETEPPQGEVEVDDGWMRGERSDTGTCKWTGCPLMSDN